MKPLIKFRNDGLRRCQSIAPLHGDQCEQPKRHRKEEQKPVHEASSLVWGDDGSHRHLGEDWIDGPVGSKIRFSPVSTLKFDGVDLSKFVVPGSLRIGEALHKAAESLRAEETGRKLKEEMPSYSGEPIPQQAFGSVDPAVELAEWWRDKAEGEIAPTVDKAVEYGSTDLIDIGMMLGRTMGRAVNEEEAAELGVFFYLIGKIARWQSAIQRGERPSDDTLFDIGVYVRMAQRIRDSGGWPGTEKA